MRRQDMDRRRDRQTNGRAERRTSYFLYIPILAEGGGGGIKISTSHSDKKEIKNCLWWPCLLTDRDEISNLYGVPFIHATYQVSTHWTNGFERRRLTCEHITDGQRRRTTTDGRHRDSRFPPDPLTNMHVTGNYCC
jgi:hypothetical protein